MMRNTTGREYAMLRISMQSGAIADAERQAKATTVALRAGVSGQGSGRAFRHGYGVTGFA
jgi:hypothetical protein